MKLGTNDIGSVYLGTNAVQKVYLGTNEVWSSYAYLLDDYSGAAAAYSLRLLRSAYTGDAIRVRRASDNTELDIGFVSNELDTSALTTFCSGTNGFVKTWYDQSGNGYDATQTTSANQPQIVSSGSVILENGKPTAQFDGSDDFMNCGTSFLSTFNSPFSVYTINTFDDGQPVSTSIVFGVSDNISPTYANLITTDNQPSGTIRSIIRANAQAIDLTSTAVQPDGKVDLALYVFQMQSTTLSIYKNTTLYNTGTNASMNLANMNLNSQDFYFGKRNLTAAPLPLDGNISEFIVWNSDQNSNRSGIYTNLNNYYTF
jgi:hypothetical protein